MLQGRRITPKLLTSAFKTLQWKDSCTNRHISACVSSLLRKTTSDRNFNRTILTFSSKSWSPGFKRLCSHSAQVGTENFGDLPPEEFTEILAENYIRRGFVIYNEETRKIEASHLVLQGLADRLQAGEFQYESHEGVFFGRGPRSNCLLCVFLWKTNRGQGV